MHLPEGRSKEDGFVKSPSAAWRCIPAPLNVQKKPTQGFLVLSCRSPKILYLTGCIIGGVQVSTPHSVGFARLASEAFYPIRKVKLALLDIKYLTGWGFT